MIIGREHGTDFERGPATPAPPMRVDLPDTVHPEVGVQREVVAEAEELVLAARDHFAHGNAGQIGRRQGGHPEFGSGQHPASKHLVQPLACPPDGVSLGHDLIVPCERPLRTSGAERRQVSAQRQALIALPGAQQRSLAQIVLTHDRQLLRRHRSMSVRDGSHTLSQSAIHHQPLPLGGAST